MMTMILASMLFAAEPSAQLGYAISFDLRSRRAKVALDISQKDRAIRTIQFDDPDDRFASFQGDGVEVTEKGVVWTLPEKGGRMTWTAQLQHERSKRAYDARATPSWALFRGTDVVPLVRYRKLKEAELSGTVRFQLPGAWTIWGPYGELHEGKRGKVDDRKLPAPRGWFMAGETKVRKVSRGGLEIALVSPKSYVKTIHERAAFLAMVLPHFLELTQASPQSVLIVSAGDPMWRGGLSGPGSFFLHADRPLVTDDSTTPLIHELFHVVSRARSRPDGDWIVEGMAEWVALRTLAAAGGLNEEEYARALRLHKKRARKAGKLLSGPSTENKTRKALTVLEALDGWMKEKSERKVGLRQVVALIVESQRPFDTADFISMVEKAVGVDPKPFFARHDVLPKNLKPASDAAAATATPEELEDEGEREWSHGG